MSGNFKNSQKQQNSVQKEKWLSSERREKEGEQRPLKTAHNGWVYIQKIEKYSAFFDKHTEKGEKGSVSGSILLPHAAILQIDYHYRTYARGLLLSGSSTMKGRIEYFARFEDADSDIDELAHHGPSAVFRWRRGGPWRPCPILSAWPRPSQACEEPCGEKNDPFSRFSVLLPDSCWRGSSPTYAAACRELPNFGPRGVTESGSPSIGMMNLSQNKPKQNNWTCKQQKS